MSNSNMSPIFPMPHPQHYLLTDYGFNPQFHYFQVLEEARKQKKERVAAPTAQQFKKKHSSSSRSKRWLKNAFRFIRAKITHWPVHQTNQELHDLGSRVYQVRAALSGPLYTTESRSKSATPYRTSRSRSASGLNFTTKDKTIPYINLRELNMDQHPRRSNTASLPIYLVT
ncbi:hypothetical protein DCAR_0726726 [Daucus carota subsp. sativus]|uniref:Uncharacterized protein n=1 Tax=Daucus carota subsp. sativus TaxID=79200 RepID=A0A164SJ11_DAUCS|nr:PREDICTED: uncharacterized protein LOC108195335 [Daucus carota subsp. sativus]WOH07296.1 hypothetical protein DCAR_0726726 [Daucus carota subsp. sativus]